MRLVLCLFVTSVVFVPSGFAQSAPPDEPEANPGRPTVSTPATVTPVGYLQFETGFLGASDSPEFSSRYGFNEVMKLSVARAWNCWHPVNLSRTTPLTERLQTAWRTCSWAHN